MLAFQEDRKENLCCKNEDDTETCGGRAKVKTILIFAKQEQP
jgi:hypothetical protein